MRRAASVSISLFCLVLACARPAYSQIFSLWADEGMNTCEVIDQAPFSPFTVYVFLEPALDGAVAAEYKLTVLAGHFASATNPAPFVSGVTIGSWIGSPGISAPFTACQTGTVWIVNLTMIAPNETSGYYRITPNDNTDFLGIASCQGTRPLIDGTVLTPFGYNAACAPTAEEASWGSIKSQYRQ